MTTTPAPGRTEIEDRDQRVHLHGASWTDYERLLAIRGERRVPRITYLQGELELMSPSRRHERIAESIGLLLMVWAMEQRLPLRAFGTTTWRDRRGNRGAEADKCFLLGANDAPRPDLAIEVVVTSGGIDELEVYRGLGVPEVWFWRDARITVHVLHDDRYEPAASSAPLPQMDVNLLARLAARRDQTKAARVLQWLLRRR